jgi:predicted DNA-binding transcriptional regulator AlpA
METNLDDLVLRPVLARALGVSVRTLRVWERDRGFPPPVGRLTRKTVFFSRSAVAAWLAAQGVRVSADALRAAA